MEVQILLPGQPKKRREWRQGRTQRVCHFSHPNSPEGEKPGLVPRAQNRMGLLEGPPLGVWGRILPGIVLTGWALGVGTAAAPTLVPEQGPGQRLLGPAPQPQKAFSES